MVQPPVRREARREPKVAELEEAAARVALALRVHQVLRLHVAVRDALAVQVGQAVAHLQDHALRLRLATPSPSDRSAGWGPPLFLVPPANGGGGGGGRGGSDAAAEGGGAGAWELRDACGAPLAGLATLGLGAACAALRGLRGAGVRLAPELAWHSELACSAVLGPPAVPDVKVHVRAWSLGGDAALRTPAVPPALWRCKLARSLACNAALGPTVVQPALRVS